MAHFAELDENNVVKQVIVVHNNELLDENGEESEAKGIAFCQSLFGGRWIQTSYNAKFRKRYAGIGYIYDEQKDAFISPKPFESWIFNEEIFAWEPPIPMPEISKNSRIIWDEETISWKEIPIE